MGKILPFIADFNLLKEVEEITKLLPKADHLLMFEDKTSTR